MRITAGFAELLILVLVGLFGLKVRYLNTDLLEHGQNRLGTSPR